MTQAEEGRVGATPAVVSLLAHPTETNIIVGKERARLFRFIGARYWHIKRFARHAGCFLKKDALKDALNLTEPAVFAN